jgi:hypothetical protein
MQIHRYLNGKPITKKELSHIELATDALKRAVNDARRRMAQETVMMTESQGTMTAKPDGAGIPSNPHAMSTHG